MDGRARDREREAAEVAGDYGIFRVVRRRVRSPRGGAPLDRHTLELPDWVNVVPITADGRVVLVEQYRHGTGEVTLELPAGIIEAGEDACAAGARELEEETGWRAASCEAIARVAANPALQSNAMHVVLASGCTPDGAQHQDDGEDVRTRVVSAAELPELIAAGGIRHALVLLSWLLYERRAAGAPIPPA